MRAEFKPGGRELASLYIGAHVLWEGLPFGRMLGTVRDTRYSKDRGAWVFTVHHFNGEPWPYMPNATCVEILERR